MGERKTESVCMCMDNREANMVVIKRGGDKIPTVWCDACIATLVKALNEAGLKTVASCCGHQTKPINIVLADGREVIVARTYLEARAMEAVANE